MQCDILHSQGNILHSPFIVLTWCLCRLLGLCWRGARPLQHPLRWWGEAGTEPQGPQTALLPPWSHDHLAAGGVWEGWDEKGRGKKRKYDTTEEDFMTKSAYGCKSLTQKRKASEFELLYTFFLGRTYVYYWCWKLKSSQTGDTVQ